MDPCLRTPTTPAKVASSNKKPRILELALSRANIAAEPCSDLPHQDDVTSVLQFHSLPMLVSPLAPTDSPIPPAPNQILSNSPKFLQLQQLRKVSNLSRTPCQHLYLKGSKKGLRCSKPSLNCEVVCAQHSEKTQDAASKPKLFTKLRINRMTKNKRYFFWRVRDQGKVVLRCKDVFYILTLPRGMVHPNPPSKNDYLIRDSSGVTQWKRAPTNSVVL